MVKKIITTALLSVISVLCLGGCDIVNTIRMRQINDAVQPVVTGGDRVQLRSNFFGEKPYVYATVDGEELLFLLDSGASFLIFFDTPKVQKLALAEGFGLSMGGWGEEGRSKAFQTDIGRIDLGGVYFDQMKAAVIPISQTRYYHRPDEAFYDGVIGHDMMRHFTWEIDAPRNEIFISQSSYIPEKEAERFAMDEFFSKVSIEADLAFTEDQVAKDSSFIIDTGSRHYIKVSDSYAERHDFKLDVTRINAADFGLSGKVEHDRVTLHALTLGDVRIENIKANLIPGDDDDDLWIIGNALMNQFKTVIDYKDKSFYLVPRDAFQTDYNLLGLELRKIRSGAFVVRYVFPDLPASQQDVQVGDLITEINGKPASDIPLSDYNDLASTVGDHHLCIQRGQQCFALKAAHIKGYSDF